MSKKTKFSKAVLATAVAASAIVVPNAVANASDVALTPEKILINVDGQIKIISFLEYATAVGGGNPALLNQIKGSNGNVDVKAISVGGKYITIVQYATAFGTGEGSKVTEAEINTLPAYDIPGTALEYDKEKDSWVKPSTPEVNFEVRSISSINKTGVTVTFPSLTKDVDNATVLVTNPAGALVAVKAQDLKVSATEATFEFATALETVAEGKWFVNGKEFTVQPAATVKVESVMAINDTSIEVTFDKDAKVTAADLAGKTITLKAGETTLTGTFATGSLANGKTVFNLATGEKLVDATVYTVSADFATFTNNQLTAKVVSAYAKTFATSTTAITAKDTTSGTSDTGVRTLKVTAKNQYGEDFSVAQATNLSVEGSTLNGMPLIVGSGKEINIVNDTITINRALVEGDKLVIKVSSKEGNKVLGTSNIEFTVAKSAIPVATSVAGVKATVNGAVPTSIVAGDAVILTPDVRDQNNTVISADVRYVVTAGANLLATTGDLNSTATGSTVDKSSSGAATFTVNKPGTVTIDVFNVKNGAKYTYTVEVGAKKLTTINSPAAVNGFNNEDIKTAAITANDGAAFAPELLKFNVTDANGAATTDATVSAQLKGGTGTDKNDIILVVKSTKVGTYKVTPYVGESFTATDAVKGGVVTVTTSLNNIATSIDAITVGTLKLGTPVKKEIVIRNKHNEDITSIKEGSLVFSVFKDGVKQTENTIFSTTLDAVQNTTTKKYEVTFNAKAAGTYSVRVAVDNTVATTDIAVTAEATTLASINLGQDIYDGVISGDPATYQIITAKDSKSDSILPVIDGDGQGTNPKAWSVTATEVTTSGNAPIASNHGGSVVYVKKDVNGKWTDSGVSKATAEAIALKIDTTAASINSFATDKTVAYTVTNGETDATKKIEDSINVKVKAVRTLKEFTVEPTSSSIAVGGKQLVKITPVDQYGKFIVAGSITLASNDINTVAQVDATGTAGSIPTAGTTGTAVLAIDKDGKVVTGGDIATKAVAYVAAVEGKKAGSVKVTVKQGTITKDINVTVAAASSLVDSVKFTGDYVDANGAYKYVLSNDGSLETDGESVQLTLDAFAGTNKVGYKASDVIWTIVSGADIASVSNGLVTIKSVPTADTTITVKADLFGKTAQLVIPVKKNYDLAKKVLSSTVAVTSAGVGNGTDGNTAANIVTDLTKIDADATKPGIQIKLDNKFTDGEAVNNSITLDFTGKNGFGTVATNINGTVLSFDTAVATASLSTNTLKITPVGTGSTKVRITLEDGTDIVIDVEVAKEVGDKVTNAAEKAARDIVLANGGATIANLQALAGLSNALDVNTIVSDNQAAYITAINALNEVTATTADIQTEVNKVNAQQAAIKAIDGVVQTTGSVTGITVAQINTATGLTTATEANLAAYKAFILAAADNALNDATKITNMVTSVNASQKAIADAKALVVDTNTATATNLLTVLNALSGMSDTGVTLAVKSEVVGPTEAATAKVAANGDITKGTTQQVLNVTITIAKANGLTDEKIIAVTIPAAS